jgi:CubicO group peptidase (beta-lactamase class C family)
MRNRILLVVSLILGISSWLPAQQSSFLTEFDVYIPRVMAAFKVPGMSVAIVKDGKVILTKGYGVRKIGEAAPVDAHTLFGIASNTKGFTATAIALLVEEGKLEWDAPVINYLPWFQLSNPYVTRELTIRDLLVHRSGLSQGAGDLLFWPQSTYSRKEIVDRLRYITLATSFRSKDEYDNVLFLVAGEVIESMSGMKWEDFIQTRIFHKIGMNGSNAFTAQAGDDGNVARTHAIINGKLQMVKPYLNNATNPAGGINSNAVDMAKWMIMHLDSGRLATDGSRLFQPRTTKEIWTLVMPFSFPDPPPELDHIRRNFNGDALGFIVRDYRGKLVVEHDGGLPGYVSRLMMIPELKLGVVVLTNQESSRALSAITYYVLDHYLAAQPFDWLGVLKRREARMDSIVRATEQISPSKRDSTSQSSLSLAKYAGTYTDAWYGDINVTFELGKLTIKFLHTPSLEGTLEHWQYDTFIARWYDRELRADAYVTFALNPDGSIDQIKMKPVSPFTDFSYDFQDLLFKPAAGPKAK